MNERSARSGDKISKARAGYRPRPSGREHCRVCTMWLPPAPGATNGRCTLVAGAIEELGWCKHFEDEAEDPGGSSGPLP